jgi:hypothetical protein
VVSLL